MQLRYTPHRPNAYGSTTTRYHVSSGVEKYSGSPYPPSSVGRWAGGGDIVNVWAKSRALFIYRIQAQSQRNESLTAGWLKKWNLHSRTENPPFPDRIPASLEYLRSYIVDVAYIPRQGGSESAKAYKKSLYTTLQMIHNASFTPQEMRIARMRPQSDWQKIWKNLTTAPMSEADKAVWNRIIHNILPTNERLHWIKMSLQTSIRNVTSKILSCTE